MPPITDEVRDRRIARIRPLVSPALLREDLPLLDAAARVVVDGRDATSAILTGADDRLLVVVGPCSVHDPRAVAVAAKWRAWAMRAAWGSSAFS